MAAGDDSHLEKMSNVSNNNTKVLKPNTVATEFDVIETPYGRLKYKEDLVGCRIKVWWPLDKRFYEGVISSYDVDEKKHQVNYNDGDVENLNLNVERWEFIDDEILAKIGFVADKQTPRPHSDVRKKAASANGRKETFQSCFNEKAVIPVPVAKAGDKKNHLKKVVQRTRSPSTESEAKKRLKLSDDERQMVLALRAPTLR